jgi:uncharacterized repeat protein (TIGR01451 family)
LYNRHHVNKEESMSIRRFLWQRSGDGRSRLLRAAGIVLAALLVAALLTDGAGAQAAAPGTMVAWGSNDKGQTNVPANLGGVVAIAAGGGHSLALKRDGTVVAWGYNGSGQATVPAGLSDVVAIAAGDAHSLALKRDGTVVAWGNYLWGELVRQVSVPAGLSGVVAIAAGDSYSLALKKDGTVVEWDNSGRISSLQNGLSDVTAIAAGFSHSLALKRDGTVVAWGRNDYGQATVPAGLNDVTAIAAGITHSLALRRDGTVVAWGRNDYGQATVPAGLNDVTAIATGIDHNLALKRDGTVVAWGKNAYGETLVPAGLSGVTAISAGYYHSMALVADTTTPSISVRITGTRGGDGWYTSDVSVKWNLVEEESWISAQSGCDATTISSDTATTPLTCSTSSTGGTISASVTVKRDGTPPSTRSRVSAGTSRATITLDASDSLSGLAATSYSINGGAPQTYTGPFTLSGAGSYSIRYFSTDRAGNVEAAQILPVTIGDQTPPRVTIKQAAGQADPASSSPINFMVRFSEPVTGFTDADVSLGGTAGATTAQVSESAPNDGRTYAVAVSGMTASGTVTASIPAGVAQDAAGNPNSASTSADNSVSYVPAPDLTLTKRHTGNFTQGQSGALYTITVSNSGTAPTSGMVQVMDSLPAGLAANAIGGSGWTCKLTALVCTRSDALAAGGSYPDITLTVVVARNAPASLTNHASVAGGGEQNTANSSASDPTTIAPSSSSGAQLLPDL